MTTAKPQPHPKLHRSHIFRGSLVFVLLVALMVVTQLMESISVTNLIESSIYIHSTSTKGTNQLEQPPPPSSHLKPAQSQPRDELVQRRSTIQVPMENDLHDIISSDDSNNDDDDDEEENDDDDDGESDDEESTTTTDSDTDDDDDDEMETLTTSQTLSNPANETENIMTVLSSTTTTTTTTIVTSTSKIPTVTTRVIPNIIGPNHQTNRTLVIVLGNVRGGIPAWKSMIREVLDPNQADLALLVGEGDPVHPPERTLLHDRAKYIWTVREFDDWADAMDDIPNSPPDWRERLFRMTNSSRRGNILLGAAHNITGSGALVFMFRFYLSQKIIEYDLLSIYDRFVVTRSDHYYLCVHDLSEFSNEYIWVPQGSDHYGICDRHFIASNETILSALDILPPLVRNPEAYRTQLQTYPYNTERFLLLRWEQEGLRPLIQRFNRTLFLVSSSKDQTRWKPKGRYIKHLDVYLKYSQEYRLSSKSCRARNIQKMQRLKARKQPQKQQQQRQSK